MTPDIHTLTGAYAVDALPDDERRSFEAHLAECEACAQEVDELQATAARLGAASTATPPAGLRDAVMAQIADVRQEGPSRLPSVPDLPRIAPSRIAPSRRWMSSVLAPAAAIVAIAILGLSAIVANLSSRIDQIETESSQLSSVIAAPDAQTIEIDTGGSETARLIVAPSLSEAVLLVNGMPAAPEDHRFAIWLIDREGTPDFAGSFDVDDRGRATRVVAGDLAGTAALGVTVEPAGQPVTEPTSDPVMVAELPTV